MESLASAPLAPPQLRRCAAANGCQSRGCAPSRRPARPCRALAILAAGAAAAAGLLRLDVFVAPPSGRPAPPAQRRSGAASTAVAASPPARTAAEEQEIADKLDDVLREKLAAKDAKAQANGESGQAKRKLSSSAQRAVEAATGQPGQKKAKKPQKKAAKIVKSKSEKPQMVKSLDEILKSASDETDRVGTLARRDVYKEVGITSAEVEAYWDRRDESSQSFTDKILVLAYPLALLVFLAICFSVYDSTVNPQVEYTASMTGTG